MQVFKVILVGMILAVIVMPLPGHSAAQPPQKPAPPVERVNGNGNIKLKLNFQDAPLQTVLEYLSETAGLTIVSDTSIADGRMTVISRQPISLEEAVSLINSMLKEKNLTTVLNGKVLKVVTLEAAKREPIPVLSGNNPDAIVGNPDDVVTYVIPVTYVTARALRENLQTLIPEYASLEANEDGNALIVTDTLANIKRIMKIVKALDTHMASSSEIRVFRLNNADATSASNMINTMFQQNQSGRSSSSRGSTRGGTSGNPFQMMMDRMRGGGGPGGFGGRGGGR